MSKKNAVCLFGAIYCFVIIFSVTFIAVEAEHDCTGEDCPICFNVSLCAGTLRQSANFSQAFFTFAGMFILVPLFKFLCTSYFCGVCRTPVNLKIKLSD